jgi:aromatic ring-opening dioxygenase catalytic subunit (LigB family)
VSTEIVGGFGVPHTPHYPAIVASGGPGAEEIAALYGAIRTRLEDARPDVVVFYTCDHYNVFWETSIPIFSIGVAESAWGASDYDTMPRRELAIASELAVALQRRLVRAGFDVGKTQEFAFDHTVIAPMHFLAPGDAVPVVPIFLSALIPPLPTAARCRAFGEAVHDALLQEDAGRVAVVTSGSFSLEIAGPRSAVGSHVGVPDPAWMDRVLELLAAGDLDRLVAESTEDQLWAAGNAGGETLLWIAMLATVAGGVPAFLDAQREWGHGYGAWTGAIA